MTCTTDERVLYRSFLLGILYDEEEDYAPCLGLE
jgi:hypothetical protein